MPAPAKFHQPFQTYLEQICIAQTQDQHQDYRRGNPPGRVVLYSVRLSGTQEE